MSDVTVHVSWVYLTRRSILPLREEDLEFPQNKHEVDLPFSAYSRVTFAERLCHTERASGIGARIRRRTVLSGEELSVRNDLVCNSMQQVRACSSTVRAGDS